VLLCVFLCLTEWTECVEYCEATETQTVTIATESSQDASSHPSHPPPHQQQQQQQQHMSADYVSLSVDADAAHNVSMYAQLQFLPRHAMHKRGLCRHEVSMCMCVRLSVCPSRSWIVSKRINISSIFLHHRLTKSY